MYATEDAVKQMLRVYSPSQYGGQLNSDLQYYVPSVRRQRGSGLGSVLRNVFSKIIPFAKKWILPAAKQYVLPHAKEMAKNVALDALQGENIKESLKTHGKVALKKSGKQLVEDQLGSGKRGRRKRVRRSSSIKRSGKKKKKAQSSFL